MYELSDTICEVSIASQYSCQFGRLGLLGANTAQAPTIEFTSLSRAAPTGKYMSMFV
jgi:hypothetical protein